MVYYEPNDALVARYPGGSFGINLYEFSTEHFFSAEDGMPYSSIGVITHGVVTIKSAYAKVDIPTGGIFYISADEKYTSTWTGDPDVDFTRGRRLTGCRRADASPYPRSGTTGTSTRSGFSKMSVIF